jgi:hypothetical protein
MKSKYLIPFACLIAVSLVYSCVKSSNPSSTVYDTSYITKYDTVLVPQKLDTPNLTEGLVLYLPFNGSFADSSGSGNTVVATGSVSLGYDLHGYAQSAFSSSGNGRLVVSNNGAYAVDTAFSLSFDFTVTGHSSLVTFLSIVDTVNGNGPTFNCGMNAVSSPQVFNFGTNTSAGGCNNSGDNNSQNVSATTNFIPQIGSWYNAICIFTNGNLSVYINGQLQGTSTVTNPTVLFCPSSNFVIGGWWDNGENMIGELDEVRFYNRTLTAQQIAWLSRNFQPSSTKVNIGVKTGGAPGIGVN